MLAYYPLEHIYYLGQHGIIPATITSPFSLFSSKKSKLTINFNKIALWSTRCWAAYVFLHFAHLYEDWKLLKLRHSSIRKAKGSGGLSVEEKTEMGQRRDAFWSEVVINLGYLPLTIHWYVYHYKNAFSELITVALIQGHWKKGYLKTKSVEPVMRSLFLS